MRLHDVDDLPFHQAPTPFNVVATSDVHFNDGYWFGTYAPDCYLVVGLRVHPNTNVMDGFAGLMRGGEQRVVRCSRALRPKYSELCVGPLRVDVARPLERIRLSLGDTPVGVSFELEFSAQGPPYLEAPYQHRKYGHLIHDMVRYTQICRSSGSIRCDGEEIPVESWHAMRDHSWGVRAGMGPRTPTRGTDLHESEADRRRFRLWVPFEVEDHTGFFHTHEDQAGNPLDVEGELVFRDGSSTRVTEVRHDLDYHPGTKNVSGGRFSLRDASGTWRDYRFEAAGTPADVQGFGYYGGWRDRESAGVYRGEGPVVEHDRYAVDPRAAKAGPPHVPAEKRLGPTEFPSLLVGPGDSRGMAHFEHHVLGRYEPYGFA